jgi:hypothetical protein
LPNPKIGKDVRTYLSSWKEEKVDAEETPSLDLVFNEFPNLDKLLSLLEIERCQLLDTGDENNAMTVGDQIKLAREILFQKCDYVTAAILQVKLNKTADHV